jgi:hypothetical protein
MALDEERTAIHETRSGLSLGMLGAEKSEVVQQYG